MAAACGSLDHIFEKKQPLLSENPTLLESLSPWNQIKSIKHNLEKDSSNYTELFGELHFKDNHLLLQPSSVSPPLSSFSQEILQEISKETINKEKNYSPDENERSKQVYHHPPNRKQYRENNSTESSCFSSMNSESLSLCTEGLGFESSDDVEECFDFQYHQEKIISMCEKDQSKKSRTCKVGGGGGSFPPPISCIGKTGKPWVCFKSYREDGRFILQEIRIPIQETLHACREDGRLKLHFVQSESDDEVLEQEEGENNDCDFGEINCEQIDGKKVEDEDCK